MLNLVVEMREIIVSTLNLLVDQAPDGGNLTDMEWDTISTACDLLKPTFEVTAELASERYSPASKIILMARGLVMLCQKQLNSPHAAAFPQVVRRIGTLMLTSMSKWYSGLESSRFVGGSLFIHLLT